VHHRTGIYLRHMSYSDDDRRFLTNGRWLDLPPHLVLVAIPGVQRGW
jgi:hypothetical protein